VLPVMAQNGAGGVVATRHAADHAERRVATVDDDASSAGVAVVPCDRRVRLVAVGRDKIVCVSWAPRGTWTKRTGISIQVTSRTAAASLAALGTRERHLVDPSSWVPTAKPAGGFEQPLVDDKSPDVHQLDRWWVGLWLGFWGSMKCLRRCRRASAVCCRLPRHHDATIARSVDTAIDEVAAFGDAFR
jgi:hypothetical protein